MKMCLACGELFADSVVSLHYDRCIARADIRAKIAEQLRHPDHPGYALSHRDYDALRPVVSSPTLRRRLGTWPQICAMFGLLPISAMPKPPKPVEGVDIPKRQHVSTGKRQRNLLNAPLTEAERHACTRRGMVEDAATGGIHCALRSVVAR